MVNWCRLQREVIGERGREKEGTGEILHTTGGIAMNGGEKIVCLA